jgi:hypothetical protein
VKAHLHNAFAKLDITSRAELGQVVRDTNQLTNEIPAP